MLGWVERISVVCEYELNLTYPIASCIAFDSLFLSMFLHVSASRISSTPLGEAQMNGNKEIVSLIKNNYTTNVPEEYVWHDEIDREYNTSFRDQQQMHWARLGADGEVEVYPHPPPMSIQKVLEARESFGERNVVRRIHPKSLLSMQQLEYERQRRIEHEKLNTLLKNRAKIVEERCAVKLQAHWRKL